MIKQENENNEMTKQPNEDPLIFTKEERKFIELSFRATREAFKDELDIEDEDHIRLALKKYHDRYHMPGGRPHQLMRDIFRKMGYWHDGKTTLIERENNILNQKLENEKRLANINLKRQKALDEQLEAIQKEKEQLANDPTMHKIDLTKEYAKIEGVLQEQIKKQEEENTLKLQKFLQEQQEAYEVRVKSIFNKAEQDKEKIKQLAMRDATIKSEAKLTEALRNIENIAPKESTLEVEIIKQNKEINLELQNLDTKTVAQLRAYAKKNDIDWTYSLRKDELIEHIQNEMEKK